MNREDRTVFRNVLLNIYGGNRGAAEQESEAVVYDNTYNLSDDYDRIKQDRINYEIKKHSRIRNTY